MLSPSVHNSSWKPEDGPMGGKGNKCQVPYATWVAFGVVYRVCTSINFVCQCLYTFQLNRRCMRSCLVCSVLFCCSWCEVRARHDTKTWFQLQPKRITDVQQALSKLETERLFEDYSCPRLKDKEQDWRSSVRSQKLLCEAVVSSLYRLFLHFTPDIYIPTQISFMFVATC